MANTRPRTTKAARGGTALALIILEGHTTVVVNAEFPMKLLLLREFSPAWLVPNLGFHLNKHKTNACVCDGMGCAIYKIYDIRALAVVDHMT